MRPGASAGEVVQRRWKQGRVCGGQSHLEALDRPLQDPTRPSPSPSHPQKAAQVGEVCSSSPHLPHPNMMSGPPEAVRPHHPHLL